MLASLEDMEDGEVLSAVKHAGRPFDKAICMSLYNLFLLLSIMDTLHSFFSFLSPPPYFFVILFISGEEYILMLYSKSKKLAL
jgi:hypothetical protein